MTEARSERVITALDAEDWASASTLLERLPMENHRVKVGKQLFTRSGPCVVEELHARGSEVFLDLKFHDIPNTVAGAVQAAAELGVWMVNVHASGGPRMMEAARRAVEGGGSRPWLIAVTVLTSMDARELHSVGVAAEPEEQVLRLARLARESGMDGVVASPAEVPLLRRELGPDFLLVTPGVRPAGSGTDDQRRSATPGQAVADGSDYLVIGRPLTRAEDPRSAWEAIIREMSMADDSA
ncbi:orotidine-5'-phosphate decarboxylase [Thiohalorhabdus methylotrophus]|uniref:Orotidine 5'-phosphate decarboxylase n=1 Tax=Thiohalorhabdus methylotrophus TaxID=3242694 RepID=A0ABV4TYF3_9GAMM